MDYMTMKGCQTENSSNALEKNLNIVKEYLPEIPNIVQNYQEIDFPDSGIEIVDYTTDNLMTRFQEITSLNLESEDSTMLVVKRFNINSKEIEVTDTQEYLLIKDFLHEGIFPEISQENVNMVESEIGKLIMDGYRRYLKENNFLTFNFHQVFELCHRNKDTWYYLDETHKNFMACFQNLPNQYLDLVDERYKYLGCLILVNTDRKTTFRLPIYLDKNSEISIPSMRHIKNRFFTMYNISMDKDIYLDYNIESGELYLITDESRELVRYQITQQGISFFSEFPEYLNRDYLEEIKIEENKHIFE